MPHLRCPQRRSSILFAALVAASLAGLWLSREAPAQSAVATKRPLTHHDYDSWRSIQAPQLSPDGRFAAYTLVPQEGDTTLVVRELAPSAKEYRHGRGRPAVPTPTAKGGPTPEALAPPATGGKVAFTADSKRLVFSIAPTKAEQEASKKNTKEMPKSSLGIMDLTTGKVTVIPGVRSFQVGEEGGAAVVYHKAAPVEAPGGAKKKEEKTPEEDEDDFLQPAKFGDKKPAAPARQMPSDLVVRNLGDGSEVVIVDVVEYTFTRRGDLLVCAIAAKEADDNGVFAFYGDVKEPKKLHKQALMVGKAKYSRLTWDENQRFLAFFVDRGSEGKEAAQLSLYVADRDGQLKNENKDAPKAVELVKMRMPAFKDDMVLSERGGFSFSDDGLRVFFGVAPPPVVDQAEAKDGKDKAVVELWHWNDDFIQPMQKVRAALEKNRTYRAVVHLTDRKVVQLADKTLIDVLPSRNGRWALASDDKPHRPLVAYDSAYADWYLIDTANGSRKQLVRKSHLGLTWSPNSHYAVFFDGKDWNSVSVPDGTVTNLTKGIGVKFHSEDHDMSNMPVPYGMAGWTPDDYFVLLYDKYDIWKVSAKGGGHEILTRSVGREGKIQLRYVKLEPKDKSIDLSKPLLLRAENLQTRDSGFYRLDPALAPKPLVMQAAYFGIPLLAKFADVFLVTRSTFYDFPDLYVNRSDFKAMLRISDANPQKEHLLWGKAELVHYKNTEGVALSGILIKPENFDPKKKYPLMVYIYERLSQNLHHFADPKPGTSINPSYYASNGYLVFMPDITYTVGYPGQSALRCVLPGINAVVDQGGVNEAAIGIQGHSWGGYQIAYMITQTKRFKAAAAGAPVSNMTSAYGGIRWGTGLPRQFQYEKTQSRIGGSLWDFPMRFVENSPVFMADRVKTPLLMLHNDQDDAVPWYQGIEFYLALRRLGKEVYLINYPGELHGLKKRANQVDYTIRMQEFFDHHLKGAPMPAWMANGIPYMPPPGTKEEK